MIFYHFKWYIGFSGKSLLSGSDAYYGFVDTYYYGMEGALNGIAKDHTKIL
jgi:hypothetical protein